MKINDGLLEVDFLTIPDETKYWFVRAGTKAEFYQDFKRNNFIAIGDNEVKLTSLRKIDDKYKHVYDTLKEAYKNIFNETFLKLLIDSPKYNSLGKSEQAESLEQTRRSSTIAANKTMSFVEEMSMGDIVLLPYKRSEKFLVGIIISDVFDFEIDHEYVNKDENYSISKYEKKRRILWLKEISQNELPDKLQWIQKAHKAIFDISKNASEINPILSSEYIYKGNAYLRVNVGTDEKVSSNTWLHYQQLINNSAKDKADELYQKNKVQSSGQTILEIAIQNKEIIALVGFSLFYDIDVDIKGLKFKHHAPLSFLIPGSKARKERESKKENLQIEEQELKNNSLELDNKAKEIQNKKDLLLLKELENRIDLTKISEEVIDDLGIGVEKTNEQKNALLDMKISQKPIGTEISKKTQAAIQKLKNN